MEKEKNDQHYFDLGFMQGKRKFNTNSFIDGFVIVFFIAILLYKLILF